MTACYRPHLYPGIPVAQMHPKIIKMHWNADKKKVRLYLKCNHKLPKCTEVQPEHSKCSEILLKITMIHWNVAQNCQNAPKCCPKLPKYAEIQPETTKKHWNVSKDYQNAAKNCQNALKCCQKWPKFTEIELKTTKMHSDAAQTVEMHQNVPENREILTLHIIWVSQNVGGLLAVLHWKWESLLDCSVD